MEETIAGGILLVLSTLMVIRPDVWLRVQILIQKKLMGADYVPSTRTTKRVRIIGILVVTLGVLALSGLI